MFPIILLACSSDKSNQIREKYETGIDFLENDDKANARQIFEQYAKLVKSDNINDSTLTIFSHLAKLYYESDSIDAAIYYCDLIINNCKDRDINSFLDHKLRKATYLLDALYLKQCQATLDSITVLIDSFANSDFKIRYALLKDRLKFETYGYWDCEEIIPAVKLLNKSIEPTLFYQMKIRQAIHDIFNWEFKKADSLISNLESLSDNWNNQELITELKLCRAAYWDEQKDYRKTEQILKELLNQYNQSFDKQKLLRIKTELARALLNRKKYNESKIVIDELLAYFKLKGDKFRELEIQYIRLDYMSSVGKFDQFFKEIDFHVQSAEEIGYRNMAYQFQILNGLALKNDLNRERAIDVFDKMIHQRGIALFKKHQYYSHIQKASTLISDKQFDLAIDQIDRMKREFADGIYNRILYYHNLTTGRALYYQGKYQASCNHFEKAKKLCSEIGFPARYYAIVNNLSIVYSKFNRSDEYLATANEALEYFETVGNLKYLSDIYYNLGKFEYDNNELHSAINYWLISIDYKEKERLEARDQDRLDILSKEIGIYYSIQKCYFTLKDYINCFVIGERAKSKWMEEKLNFGNTEMAVPQLEEIQQYMQHGSGILIFSNQLYSKTLATLITKDSIYCRMVNNFNYVNKLLSMNRFYLHLKESLDSIDLYKIKEQIAKSNKVSHYYSETVIKEFVSYYRNHLQFSVPNRHEQKETKDMGASLYHFLIGELYRQLTNIEELIVVPDDYIGMIPFETLITNDSKYLVEDLDISYIQSVTIWDYLQKRNYSSDRKEMLAFGNVEYEYESNDTKRSSSFTIDEIEQYVHNLDSFEQLVKNYQFRDIPGSKKELEYISDVFPNAEIKHGSHVSEKAIKRMSLSGELKKYKILHFSTHGIYVNGFPHLSSLVLSSPKDANEDGFLNLNEIAGLKIEADVVNLSACETGIGDVYSGEGIVGMAQAFTIAGANGMIVSLWRVPDNSTSLFMERVYEKVKEEGKGFKEAINQVKRDYIKGDYSEFDLNPSYWASFYYFGR